MRRHLLQALRAANMPVQETSIELADIEQASEIFLTNAIYGIRWVKQFGKHAYTQQLAPLLHKKMVETTF